MVVVTCTVVAITIDLVHMVVEMELHMVDFALVERCTVEAAFDAAWEHYTVVVVEIRIDSLHIVAFDVAWAFGALEQC